ncbi:MAG: universal stress protein [Paenibacillaceae bacterium]|jgi:TusA-related sulfurtransferase|nr:universal stress protein [Paenibacillaceae bacterium]
MFFRKKTTSLPAPQQLGELNKIELDVREELRQKKDPFELIMGTVKKLGKNDLLVLHATIKPTPLLGLMKLKGYSHKVEKIQADYWITMFVHKSLAPLLKQDDPEESAEDEEPQMRAPGEPPRTTHLDNRGLEPPQPMVRTLAALKNAAPGDRIIIHNDRVPAFLLEEIKEMGYPCDIASQADGSAIVTIEKI